MHHVLGSNQSNRLKTQIEFNTQKKNESIKNGDKCRKSLYRLMNCNVCVKAM